MIIDRLFFVGYARWSRNGTHSKVRPAVNEIGYAHYGAIPIVDG